MNLNLNTNNFALIPCHNNSKIPATQHGFKDAKFNVDTETLLKNGFNIAVACEMSNLIVIDVDVHNGNFDVYNGMDELEDIEKKLGSLPEDNFRVLTPNDGMHIYASSYGIRRPKGKIGKFIDIKYNGYCLLPPSKINGKSYSVLNGVTGNGMPIIKPLPSAWIDFINKPGFENEKAFKAFKEKDFKAQCRHISDPELKAMLEQCDFIQKCILEAESLEEPLWFAFASLLSDFSNGLELFDYYSQPYPEYTKEATKKKYENASKYNVNCKTIASIFDDCSKCTKGKKYGE